MAVDQACRPFARSVLWLFRALASAVHPCSAHCGLATSASSTSPMRSAGGCSGRAGRYASTCRTSLQVRPAPGRSSGAGAFVGVDWNAARIVAATMMGNMTCRPSPPGASRYSDLARPVHVPAHWEAGGSLLSDRWVRCGRRVDPDVDAVHRALTAPDAGLRARVLQPAGRETVVSLLPAGFADGLRP